MRESVLIDVKDLLVAVAKDRLILYDQERQTPLKSLPYEAMKSWTIQWNTGILELCVARDTRREKEAPGGPTGPTGPLTTTEQLILQAVSADSRVLLEFIGGYAFLSLRSASKSQHLDAEMFYKLTSKS